MKEKEILTKMQQEKNNS